MSKSTYSSKNIAQVWELLYQKVIDPDQMMQWLVKLETNSVSIETKSQAIKIGTKEILIWEL